MIIRLKDFLNRLEKEPYLQYSIYDLNKNLFITLYDSDKAENYLIIESVSQEEHPPILPVGFRAKPKVARERLEQTVLRFRNTRKILFDDRFL